MLLINTRLQKLFLMIAVVSLFVCGARLDAQTTYGAVRGIVKDAQGAVIAKASVVLTNQETRIARTSVTSGVLATIARKHNATASTNATTWFLVAAEMAPPSARKQPAINNPPR